MTAVRCTTRVIYGDTDQMGVVYYANYLRFFEKGRCEFLRARGISYQAVEDNGFILPVVDVACKYRLPAKFDDEVIIETAVTDVTRIRILFSYKILRADDGNEVILAEGTTTHASLNKDMRPVRIPASFVEKLTGA